MKKKLPELAGLGLLTFLIFFVVFLYLKTQRPVLVPPPVSPPPVQRPFDYNPEGYTTTQYIAPLGPEETGGDSFWSAQVRGVVSSWGAGTLTVAVGEDSVDIEVPDETMLRCLPLTTTDLEGQEYKPSEVFVDFRLVPQKGVLADRSAIAEKIPEGADLTVQVKYVDATRAEAHLIVGYGCSI